MIKTASAAVTWPFWSDLPGLAARTGLRPIPAPADAGLAELLEKNLAALPADERELVELKYFEHLPVREIAARLHVSEKAVESRLVRIRGKLKSAMLEGLKDE